MVLKQGGQDAPKEPQDRLESSQDEQQSRKCEETLLPHKFLLFKMQKQHACVPCPRMEAFPTHDWRHVTPVSVGDIISVEMIVFT